MIAPSATSVVDLLGRTPARIKLTRAITPYNDVDHQLTAASAWACVPDPDGRGVSVRTAAGRIVSLHPSEFEVVLWADPPEELCMTPAVADKPISATSSKRRGKPADAARPLAVGEPSDVRSLGVASKSRPPAATGTTTPMGIAANDPASAALAYREETLLAVAAAVADLIPTSIDSLRVASRDSAIEILRGRCFGQKEIGDQLVKRAVHPRWGGLNARGAQFDWYEVLDALLQRNPLSVAPLPATMTNQLTAADLAAASGPAVKVIGRGVMVQCDSIGRHPINRYPAPDDVAERAESLEAEGQLDDCEVRVLDDGQYQMISGETRLLAARSKGWKELRCTVIECDDAEACRRVALHNAQRKDLNTIERAQLVESLCKPKAEGGGGLTREAAAKSVGLKTGSAASNLVRLLKLSKMWQDRVACGELAESFARLIVPFAGVAAVMKELDKTYTSKEPWDRKHWESREALENHLDEVAGEHTRRFDDKQWMSGEGIPRAEYACLIHPDDIASNRKKLGIITLHVTIDDKPAEVEAATNVKLFDELQEAAVRKAVAEQGAKRAKAAGDAAEAAAPVERQKTKAELQEAAAARKQQLATAIDQWKQRLQRRLLSDAIAATKATSHMRNAQLLKLVLHVWIEGSGPHGWSMRNAADKMLGQKANDSYRHTAYASLTKAMNGSRDHLTVLNKLTVDLCAWLVDEGGDLGPRAAISGETLQAMFDDWECDLADAWRKLYARRDPRIAEFFELHRKPELHELMTEMGDYISDKLDKGALVRHLCGKPTPPKLPVCLQPAKAEAKRGKKGR